jgi:hypothetical protein
MSSSNCESSFWPRSPENAPSDEDFYGLIDNAENLGVIAAVCYAAIKLLYGQR